MGGMGGMPGMGGMGMAGMAQAGLGMPTGMSPYGQMPNRDAGMAGLRGGRGRARQAAWQHGPAGCNLFVYRCHGPATWTGDDIKNAFKFLAFGTVVSATIIITTGPVAAASSSGL
jgi:hypothetical protein